MDMVVVRVLAQKKQKQQQQTNKQKKKSIQWLFGQQETAKIVFYSLKALGNDL